MGAQFYRLPEQTSGSAVGLGEDMRRKNFKKMARRLGGVPDVVRYRAGQLRAPYLLA
jgi:hypothetical protein